MKSHLNIFHLIFSPVHPTKTERKRPIYDKAKIKNRENDYKVQGLYVIYYIISHYSTVKSDKKEKTCYMNQ